MSNIEKTESLEMCSEKLVKRLKNENPEHFANLVRMHLSFILDTNYSNESLFEQNNSSNPEKSKKRSLMRPKLLCKKMKKDPDTSLNRRDFRSSGINEHLLKSIRKLIAFLNKENQLDHEGIFRRTGSLVRQQDLRASLTANESFVIDEQQFSTHDCASVLKSMLAELPEPLLTEQHYSLYVQFADSFAKLKESNRLLDCLQLISQLLPFDNRLLFRDLIQLLHRTTLFVHLNKMTADSLATLFAPHLICSRLLNAEQLHSSSQQLTKILSFMISNAADLFSIPSPLLIDLKAYWTHKHHSSTAVNTVFSFVDREESAKASSDSTEVALAQLYAHIQSMPESAKKRKLIKQFNKENGQGTPLMSKSNNSSAAATVTSASSCKSRLGDVFRKRILKFSSEKSSEKVNKKRPILLEQNSMNVTPTVATCTITSATKRIKLETSNDERLTMNDKKTVTKLLVRKSMSESNLNSVPKNPPNINLNQFSNPSSNLNETSENTPKRLLNTTLMTPRCRKPVLLKSSLTICPMDARKIVIKKSKSDTNLLKPFSEHVDVDMDGGSRSGSASVSSNDLLLSDDEESLTATFREYLASRLDYSYQSIEDLSFSSRTGDFVNGGDDDDDRDGDDCGHHHQQQQEQSQQPKSHHEQHNDSDEYNSSDNIEDSILLLTESKMSDSLLRVLNGEIPSNQFSPPEGSSSKGCLSCQQVDCQKFEKTSF